MMAEPLGEGGAKEQEFKCIPAHQCVDGACGAGKICVPQPSGQIRCIDKKESCTEAASFGGCFVSGDRAQNGSRLHACISLLPELRKQAREKRDVPEIEKSPAFRCDCSMLPCHEGDGVMCKRLCGLDDCLNREKPQISVCARNRSASSLQPLYLV
jgi:hypothetical protein